MKKGQKVHTVINHSLAENFWNIYVAYERPLVLHSPMMDLDACKHFPRLFFVKQQQLVESLKVSLWIFIFLQFLLTPLSQFFATIPKGIQGQNIGCTQSLSKRVLPRWWCSKHCRPMSQRLVVQTMVPAIFNWSTENSFFIWSSPQISCLCNSLKVSQSEACTV